MKTLYKLEYRKTVLPIKQSKWFYLESILVLLVWVILLPEYELLLWISLCFFGGALTLQVILHINYFLHDKNTKLEIDYGNRIMTYYRFSEKLEIPFEKIVLIKRYQGRRYPKPFDSYLLPSNFYNYTVIETSENKKIKFSDFLKEEIGIYGIKKKIVVVPFLNLIVG